MNKSMDDDTRVSTPEKNNDTSTKKECQNHRSLARYKSFININMSATKDGEIPVSTPKVIKVNNITSTTNPRTKAQERNSINSNTSEFHLPNTKTEMSKKQTKCPICGGKMPEALDKNEINNKMAASIRNFYSYNVTKDLLLKVEKRKNGDLVGDMNKLKGDNKKLCKNNRRLLREKEEDDMFNGLMKTAYKKNEQMFNEEINLQKKTNVVLKWFRFRESLALKSQLEQKEKELNDTNLKLKKLEEENKATTNEINNLKKENEEQKKSFNEVQNNLIDKESKLKTLQQNNNDLKNQLDSLTAKQKEILKKNNKLNELEEENKNLKDAISVLKQDNSSLQQNKKQIEEQRIEAAKLFFLTLFTANNTNGCIDKILYVLFWLLQCIPYFGERLDRHNTIKDLNQKLNDLGGLIFSVENNMNMSTNNIKENSIETKASEILDTLDDLFTSYKGALFSKYAPIYCYLLDLCKHNTGKICNFLNQDDFLNQNRNLCAMLKRKIESLKSEDTILADKSNEKSGDNSKSNEGKVPLIDVAMNTDLLTINTTK